jgi:hypothetical protein
MNWRTKQKLKMLVVVAVVTPLVVFGALTYQSWRAAPRVKAPLAVVVSTPVKKVAPVKVTPQDAVHDYLGGLTDSVAPIHQDATAILDLMPDGVPPASTAPSAEMIALGNDLCATAEEADIVGMAAFAEQQSVADTNFAATTAKLSAATAEITAFCTDYNATTSNAEAWRAVNDGLVPYAASLQGVATALAGDYATLTATGDWAEVQPAYEEALRLLR